MKKNYKIYKTKTMGIYSLLCVEIFRENELEEEILLMDKSSAQRFKKQKTFEGTFKNKFSLTDPFVIAKFHPSKMGWGFGIQLMKYLNGKN